MMSFVRENVFKAVSDDEEAILVGSRSTRCKKPFTATRLVTCTS